MRDGDPPLGDTPLDDASPDGASLEAASLDDALPSDADAAPEPSLAGAPRTAQLADFPDLGAERLSGPDMPYANLSLLVDVELEVRVELGRRKLPLADVLKLAAGSVIELDKIVGEPLAIYANDRLIAEGEAVVIDEQFGVRVTRLLGAKRAA
jgi:flagellar motor switch protein FliN/FliY